MIYFDSNVWGTVSDWSMAGLMAISAYFLYKTLKSQNTVQETQNKLFEMENVHFRESIKPHFNFSLSEYKIHPSEDDKIIYIFEMINDSDSSAQGIYVISKKTNDAELIPNADITPKSLYKGDNPYLINISSNKHNPYSGITISIIFNDISGIRFEQKVLFVLNKEDYKIFPYPPERIIFN